MDNAQKAIMIGVGLFITIIIISAVLLITNLGTNLVTNAQGQLSNISKSLQNQVTAAYDGKTMTGAEVVAAVQQYENSEMSIVINNGTKDYLTGKYVLSSAAMSSDKDGQTKIGRVQSYPGGVYYTYTGTLTEISSAEKTNLTELQSANGAGVSAVKTYYSSIVKDAGTDTVLGIVFMQK